MDFEISIRDGEVANRQEIQDHSYTLLRPKHLFISQNQKKLIG